MTQRNIDTMDTIVGMLAEGKKLSKALNLVYTKRNVAIPFTEEMLDVRVTDLGMSTRTANALMRAHLRTVNDVVEFCSKQKVSQIKNIGTSSCIELLETILDHCWSKMSNERRTDFLIDAVERNARYLREGF